MALWYILAAISFNLLIGVGAHKKKALNFPYGFIAASFVGLTIFLASWRVWVVLVIFFVSSSLLSRFKDGDPLKKSAISFAEKGSERDAVQVLANGGTASIFSFLAMMFFGINSPLASPLLFGAVGSLASSTADTWSTEIGTSSRRDPVLIYKPWKKVPRGTSGGVTPLGTLASLLGALTIALVFLIFTTFSVQSFLIISLAGFAGGLIDSLLGATIQAIYKCPVCNKETERSNHCGFSTSRVKGIAWFNNDLVNFVANLSAGLISLVVALTLG